MGSHDSRPGRPGRIARLLARLLGEDADWVLGDLAERRRAGRGVRGSLRSLRDAGSVLAWAWSRRDPSALGQDVAYAARTLRRDLAFTFTTLLTLTIGVAASTTVFSVVHSTLLEPLPYEQPDRLSMVWTHAPEQGVHEATSAYANVADWKARGGGVFEDLATFDPTSRTLTGGAWPEQVSTVGASSNLFTVLGVEPDRGRVFTSAEEARRDRVAVVAHDFWVDRLGGGDVAGRTVEIDGAPVEVIGVMAADFAFPDRGTELWMPQTLRDDWDEVAARRGTDSWRVVGRLREGVSFEEARVAMGDIAARVRAEHPGENAGLGLSLVPLFEHVVGHSFPLALWTLFGAVGLLLLIACANAAHLIVARSVRRTGELSVRVALGATGGRLLRLVLVESLLLAGAAGSLGLALAVVGVDVLRDAAPPGMPRVDEIRVAPTVVLFATLLSLAVGVVSGCLPAWRVARRSPGDGLLASRGSAREGDAPLVRRALVVVQLALAIVLVFGANLLARSIRELRAVDPGFRTEGVLLANLAVEEADRRLSFYVAAAESVSGIPGVRAVGLVEDLMIGTEPIRPIAVEGGPPEPAVAEVRVDAVAGDFFTSVGARLLEGRDFTPDDIREGPPVAIVNETLAARLWGEEEPVGRRFRMGDPGPDAPWIEVVGVVSDMRRQGLERPAISQAFVPYAQSPSRSMNLLVRTDTVVPGLASALRERIAAIDRGVPLYRVTTVAETLSQDLEQRRFESLLLALFAVIALALAALGVHGVMQYSVTGRRGEIGVRIALGADRRRVVLMVVRQGVALALVGLGVGGVIALGLARGLSSLLFGVSVTDVQSVVVTSGVLLTVATAACWIPARRASRIDAAVALRGD